MKAETRPFPIYQLMDAFEAFTHGEPDAKPQHRSLYYYLVGYARKRGNVTRFNMPYENGMHGSGIGSWATYDAALKSLAGWGFVVYTPGANRYKVPVIELTFRNPTGDVLLTYWQSYCLSTDNPTGDNKRLIDLANEVDYEKAAAEKLETEKLVLQAEVLNLKAQLAGQAAPRKEAPATFNPSLHTDPADEQLWSVGPLTKPKPFRVICERLGFLEIDFEHYRKQALVAAEDANVSRTIGQWSGWIRNYLNNQLKNGPLLKIQAGGGTLPTHATPDSQYPPLGQEQAGQVFYITGVHDQSHDRMYATSRLNKWPTATIVSLTHPAGAYTMQDGQVIRK